MRVERFNSSATRLYGDWIADRLLQSDKALWSVTLTFKQGIVGDSGSLIPLTADEADRLVRLFASRLNKAVHKNRYKRFGDRLVFVDCREGGRLQTYNAAERAAASMSADALKRRHRHILVEKPCQLVRCRLSRVDRFDVA